MSTLTVTSNARPVVSEAAAVSVAQALSRLAGAALILRNALAAQGARVQASREVLARRRAAQQVYAMARRYDRSQPGFASDLRAAACRAMDDEQG